MIYAPNYYRFYIPQPIAGSDEGDEVGPWNPRLPAETLKPGLRAMMLTRACDDRFARVQALKRSIETPVPLFID